MFHPSPLSATCRAPSIASSPRDLPRHATRCLREPARQALPFRLQSGATSQPAFHPDHGDCSTRSADSPARPALPTRIAATVQLEHRAASMGLRSVRRSTTVHLTCLTCHRDGPSRARARSRATSRAYQRFMPPHCDYPRPIRSFHDHATGQRNCRSFRFDATCLSRPDLAAATSRTSVRPSDIQSAATCRAQTGVTTIRSDEPTLSPATPARQALAGQTRVTATDRSDACPADATIPVLPTRHVATVPSGRPSSDASSGGRVADEVLERHRLEGLDLRHLFLGELDPLAAGHLHDARLHRRRRTVLGARGRQIDGELGRPE